MLTLALGEGRVASYDVIGSGQPLLWLEGGPGYPARLGLPDCEVVADLFRCYLVDGPGAGGSSPPDDLRGYDLPHQVAFFDRVRQELGLDSWTVMGHSWGGLLGLAYAAERPRSVERLIVVDGYAGDASVPAQKAEEESARAMARHRGQPWFEAATAPALEIDASTTVEQLMDDMAPRYPLYFAHPETPSARAHIERLRREGVLNPGAQRLWDGDLGLNASTDLTDVLASVTVPTLVLVGTHDWLCGPVWARHIATNVPGAELVEFTDSGHIPQYEEPARFHDVVAEWVADRSR